MKRRNLPVTVLGITLFLAVSGFAQKADVPKRHDTVAIASEKVKELLLLMNTNKEGKVSRQDWMEFMEAEFDRLDKEKKGEIDPKELRRSNLSTPQVPSEVMGK